ncbi:glycogen synthase [Nitrincola sp. MINF-07-Sa-05]|uniref:glycogen synthase n=1 Tax=Nitrincola salilacus TaxID=3400273 RepID=UPI003918604B
MLKKTYVENEVVVHISYEIAPYSKHGGLGDVVGALPKYMAKQGQPNLVVTPWHGKEMNVDEDNLELLLEFTVPYNGVFYPVKALVTSSSHYQTIFIKNDYFFNRDGIYHDEDGLPYSDSIAIVAFFGKATYTLIGKLKINCHHFLLHDWNSTAILFYGTLKNSKAHYVIHNYRFHGIVNNENIKHLEDTVQTALKFTFQNGSQISIGAYAVLHSNTTIAVSESYRQELIENRALLHGNMEVFTKIPDSSFIGIINGIDTDIWAPKLLNHNQIQDINSIVTHKQKNKLKLYQKYNQLDINKPLCLILSRLVEEKGVFYFCEKNGTLSEFHLAQLTELFQHTNVIACGLASGENKLEVEKGFYEIMSRFHCNFLFINAYSDNLAQDLMLASDIFIFPALVEPCGLTQMYAMSYGSIPIVSPVGGLKDSVISEERYPGKGTGYVMKDTSLNEIVRLVKVAVNSLNDSRGYFSLIRRIISTDYSWERRVRPYLDLVSK